jgi:hypothetical protein
LTGHTLSEPYSMTEFAMAFRAIHIGPFLQDNRGMLVCPCLRYKCDWSTNPQDSPSRVKILLQGICKSRDRWSLPNT